MLTRLEPTLHHLVSASDPVGLDQLLGRMFQQALIPDMPALFDSALRQGGLRCADVVAAWCPTTATCDPRSPPQHAWPSAWVMRRGTGQMLRALSAQTVGVSQGANPQHYHLWAAPPSVCFEGGLVHRMVGPPTLIRWPVNEGLAYAGGTPLAPAPNETARSRPLRTYYTPERSVLLRAPPGSDEAEIAVSWQPSRQSVVLETAERITCLHPRHWTTQETYPGLTDAAAPERLVRILRWLPGHRRVVDDLGRTMALRRFSPGWFCAEQGSQPLVAASPSGAFGVGKPVATGDAEVAIEVVSRGGVAATRTRFVLEMAIHALTARFLDNHRLVVGNGRATVLILRGDDNVWRQAALIRGEGDGTVPTAVRMPPAALEVTWRRGAWAEGPMAQDCLFALADMARLPSWNRRHLLSALARLDLHPNVMPDLGPRSAIEIMARQLQEGEACPRLLAARRTLLRALAPSHVRGAGLDALVRDIALSDDATALAVREPSDVDDTQCEAFPSLVLFRALLQEPGTPDIVFTHLLRLPPVASGLLLERASDTVRDAFADDPAAMAAAFAAAFQQGDGELSRLAAALGSDRCGRVPPDTAILAGMERAPASRVGHWLDQTPQVLIRCSPGFSEPSALWLARELASRVLAGGSVAPRIEAMLLTRHEAVPGLAPAFLAALDATPDLALQRFNDHVPLLAALAPELVRDLVTLNWREPPRSMAGRFVALAPAAVAEALMVAGVGEATGDPSALCSAVVRCFWPDGPMCSADPPEVLLALMTHFVERSAPASASAASVALVAAAWCARLANRRAASATLRSMITWCRRQDAPGPLATTAEDWARSVMAPFPGGGSTRWRAAGVQALLAAVTDDVPQALAVLGFSMALRSRVSPPWNGLPDGLRALVPLAAAHALNNPDLDERGSWLTGVPRFPDDPSLRQALTEVSGYSLGKLLQAPGALEFTFAAYRDVIASRLPEMWNSARLNCYLQWPAEERSALLQKQQDAAVPEAPFLRFVASVEPPLQTVLLGCVHARATGTRATAGDFWHAELPGASQDLWCRAFQTIAQGGGAGEFGVHRGIVDALGERPSEIAGLAELIDAASPGACAALMGPGVGLVPPYLGRFVARLASFLPEERRRALSRVSKADSFLLCQALATADVPEAAFFRWLADASERLRQGILDDRDVLWQPRRPEGYCGEAVAAVYASGLVAAVAVGLHLPASTAEFLGPLPSGSRASLTEALAEGRLDACSPAGMALLFRAFFRDHDAVVALARGGPLHAVLVGVLTARLEWEGTLVDQVLGLVCRTRLLDAESSAAVRALGSHLSHRVLRHPDWPFHARLELVAGRVDGRNLESELAKQLGLVSELRSLLPVEERSLGGDALACAAYEALVPVEDVGAPAPRPLEGACTVCGEPAFAWLRTAAEREPVGVCEQADCLGPSLAPLLATEAYPFPLFLAGGQPVPAGHLARALSRPADRQFLFPYLSRRTEMLQGALTAASNFVPCPQAECSGGAIKRQGTELGRVGVADLEAEAPPCILCAVAVVQEVSPAVARRNARRAMAYRALGGVLGGMRNGGDIMRESGCCGVVASKEPACSTVTGGCPACGTPWDWEFGPIQGRAEHTFFGNGNPLQRYLPSTRTARRKSVLWQLGILTKRGVRAGCSGRDAAGLAAQAHYLEVFGLRHDAEDPADNDVVWDASIGSGVWVVPPDRAAQAFARGVAVIDATVDRETRRRRRTDQR